MDKNVKVLKNQLRVASSRRAHSAARQQCAQWQSDRTGERPNAAPRPTQPDWACRIPSSGIKFERSRCEGHARTAEGEIWVTYRRWAKASVADEDLADMTAARS